MKKLLCLAGVLALGAAFAAPDSRGVAKKLGELFLSTDPTLYQPTGYRGGKAYGGRQLIHYATVSLWVNALECARLAGDKDLENRLVAAFEPYRNERADVMNACRHVDLSIVGAIPLEIAILTGDEEVAQLGLKYADRQWEEPKEAYDWGDKWYDKIPLDERHDWWQKGYSPETRLWIDDMYMITALQSQAYRLTKDPKYIERAAKEMCLYLEKLQRADGLFNHAPGAPFAWARGNGWMAAGMAMNLKYLPADSVWRAPILAGYRKMARALLEYQRESGLWGQIVDDAASWDETSGSAMFAYALQEGLNQGLFDGSGIDAAACRRAVARAFDALVAKLDEYGNLADVCAGTGWKNDRDHYLGRPRVNGDPHGQAPLLWLCRALMEGAKGPVKHVGIFINDEDWSLRPWAVKHFGKKQQIGTQVYAMVFDLMRACGLNLLWPAMHEGGYEFVSRPENMALAAERGIRIGTSHCEPMLRNNCYIPKKDHHLWSWTKHKDFIKDYWQWSVDRYATNDVLWTIGMRGIHDGKMKDGETMAEKIAILEDVFATQCEMLAKAGAGDAPKLFVPYKEVLPIFNAGLKVPKGTTIMWVNDNFGYVRRLGGPSCEGYGGGIYWHASYHGRPHGYIHLCTTPPAFMWYELVAKCSQNGVRDVWMVNAGDVFQAEIILYALGKFAADPDGWAQKADPQGEVLRMWVRENLLAAKDAENTKECEPGCLCDLCGKIVSHLSEYYNLGFIRKPEHMCLQWSRALPDETKRELLARYEAFLAEDLAIEKELRERGTEDTGHRTGNTGHGTEGNRLVEEYFRTVGFQAQFLAHAGIIHLTGKDKDYARSVIDPLYARWNQMAGGKWSGFWCDTIDERGGMRQPTAHNRWSSQMQWPWNEPTDPDGNILPRPEYVATAYKGEAEPVWLEPVASAGANGGAWTRVPGLGTSGNAWALLPVKPGVGEGASLEYDIMECCPCENVAIIQFLPDFALWPGLKLRVGVAFDGGEAQEVAVPKSDSNIGEKDPVRNAAVQDNFVRVSIPIPAGATRLAIRALDPGVVIDRVGIKQAGK